VNPKDMTKEELMTCLAEDWDRLGRTAFSDKFWDGGRLQQRVDDYKAELFRRLVEADALRKDNEGLRKDKARLDLIESLGGHLLAVSCDIVIDCLASRAREKIDELLRSNEKLILINEQAS